MASQKYLSWLFILDSESEWEEDKSSTWKRYDQDNKIEEIETTNAQLWDEVKGPLVEPEVKIPSFVTIFLKHHC